MLNAFRNFLRVAAVCLILSTGQVSADGDGHWESVQLFTPVTAGSPLKLWKELRSKLAYDKCESWNEMTTKIRYARRTFIHRLIVTLAYTNRKNLIRTRYEPILENRARYFDEIMEVFKEIGLDAVDQLWEHLRSEVVFHGQGHRQHKRQIQSKTAELRTRITDLNRRLRKEADPDRRNAVLEAVVKLEGELEKTIDLGQRARRWGAPLDGVRMNTSMTEKRGINLDRPKHPKAHEKILYALEIRVNREYQQLLERALIGIGMNGFKKWVEKLADRNPAIRKIASGIAKKIGPETIPVCVDAARKEKAGRTRYLEALSEITGEVFGNDLDAYMKWFSQHKSNPKNKKKAAPTEIREEDADLVIQAAK